MSRLLLFCIVFLLAFSPSVFAQSSSIEFSGLKWSTEQANVTQEEFECRTTLVIQRGAIMLEDSELQDGVISVDMYSTGRFSFGGILFRAVDHENTEEVYLRLNKSGLSDAVQYTPRHNGIADWQLYNGEGYTTAANFPKNEWLTLRLEIRGDSVFTYVGESKEAVLRSELVRNDEGSKVGLWALAGARFSNFQIMPEDPIARSNKDIQVTNEALLTEWEISKVYPARMLAEAPLETLIGDTDWESISTDQRGLANISTKRHKKESGESGDATVFARTSLELETAQRLRLSFGYSDMITVYVNGKAVFEGDSKWRSRDMNFNGVVGLNDHLILDLDAGEHELIFAVSEWFGGWGFMGRVEYLDQ